MPLEVFEDRFDQMTNELASQTKGQRPKSGTEKVKKRKPFWIKPRHANRERQNRPQSIHESDSQRKQVHVSPKQRTGFFDPRLPCGSFFDELTALRASHPKEKLVGAERNNTAAKDHQRQIQITAMRHERAQHKDGLAFEQ
jgi:hypothetical protein